VVKIKCPNCGKKLKVAGFCNEAYLCYHCDKAYSKEKLDKDKFIKFSGD
jgi:uncharacterized protein (DUF983 family)